MKHNSNSNPNSNPKRNRPRTGSKRGSSQRGANFEGGNSDSKIRGSARQVLDKYLALANEASMSGDRITAENFHQHAEHYFRVVNASGADEGQPGQGRNDRGNKGNGGDKREGGHTPRNPAPNAPRNQPPNVHQNRAPNTHHNQAFDKREKAVDIGLPEAVIPLVATVPVDDVAAPQPELQLQPKPKPKSKPKPKPKTEPVSA